MKKILLVDDDAYKISIIKKVLDSTKGYDVIIENALNPGLKRLMTDRFDLILLDMSMPTFSLKENANFNSFGGIDFLKEMKRKKNKTPVIIVTQYEIFGEGNTKRTSEAIGEECQSMFDNYRGLIVFSSTNDEWKGKLLNLMEQLDG